MKLETTSFSDCSKCGICICRCFPLRKICAGGNERHRCANRWKITRELCGFFDSNGTAAEPTDFTKASQSAIPAVVHIKTKITGKKA